MKGYSPMNRYLHLFVRRIIHDERGQVLPWTVFMMVSFLGMAGLVMDVGRAYYSHNELQASTDAAALASAESLPNTTATTVAQAFSSLTGDYNQFANLQNVTMVSGYPALKCLTTLTGQGIACAAPAMANAVQVKQEAQVPTFFARLFGINYITIGAQATASERGAISSPYNVAIIVDTTASMGDTDSSSQCNSTRLACALTGVQTLLVNMAPCSALETTWCGAAAGGAQSNSVDMVSLFTFPNVLNTTVSSDYDCTSSNPTTEYYSFPKTGQSSYAPPGPSTAFYTPSTQTGSAPDGEYNATYQIVGWSNDYKTSDSATTLNPSSNIVKAVGGKSGCTGMGDPGGAGTYYAGAIYAAQASLVAEQAARTSLGIQSKNVIILVSDGDATSTQTQMGSTAGGATNGGTYPSWVNECHQAITAANAATTAGTEVIAVSYGSEASGCTTDTVSITPCSTMQQIASSTAHFYSDYAQSGSGLDTGCVGTATSTSNLNTIFTDIATTFTDSRLIPDSTP